MKVISSRHDATVCARSSTGFELLLLINFQPRRWKSFQFGKDRKYANWPYHHQDPYTQHKLNIAPPQDDQWVSKRAPLLPYQHLVVTTRCIDESWCIDYKNTIPHIKAMCRLLNSSSSIAHDESPCSFQRLFTSPPIQGGMSEQLCFSGGEALLISTCVCVLSTKFLNENTFFLLFEMKSSAMISFKIRNILYFT